MLKEASGIKKIILRCGRTDLRKGIDGLKSIVSLHYGLDPMEEGTVLYSFINAFPLTAVSSGQGIPLKHVT